MRGCLLRLVVIVAVLAAAAWFLVPIGVDALIGAALAASGVQGTGTTVEAIADPPPLLLTGHAGRVVVHSSDVSIRELRAGRLDLTLLDVDLLSRSVGRVDGVLSNVHVVPPGGLVVAATSATIQGAASAATTTLQLSAAEVEGLVSPAIVASVGPAPASIALAPPATITFRLGGRAGSASLVAEGGSLVLRPIGMGIQPITLLEPPPGAIWRVASVQATAQGLQLVMVLDLASLLH